MVRLICIQTDALYSIIEAKYDSLNHSFIMKCRTNTHIYLASYNINLCSITKTFLVQNGIVRVKNDRQLFEMLCSYVSISVFVSV